MNNSELKVIERRSEFSRVMREAQAAKREGNWALVREYQIQLSQIINNSIKKGE